MDTISFKIPEELNQKLEHFSKANERPKSYLIRKAIEEFLIEMEEDEADYQEAMRRLNDPKAEYVPLEEVMKKYGLEG